MCKRLKLIRIENCFSNVLDLQSVILKVRVTSELKSIA